MSDPDVQTTRDIERVALQCAQELRRRQFAETGFGGVPVASDADLLAWGPPSGAPPSPRLKALLEKAST